MKKLLSILTLFVFSSSTIPQINFAYSNPSKINNHSEQKNLIKTKTIETIINKTLNNDQEDEKKYLIEGFDDPNLINKIQTELASIVHKDDKGSFIYQNDVNGVSILNLSDSDIASFKGLEFFPNLISLNISVNNQSINLADLQLISRKITILNVSRNTINDIDIIMYFISLKVLTVSEMKMPADFTWDSLLLPLSGITTLNELDLSSNKNISDISLLSTLINLTDLDLGANKISDISALINLTKITYLDLGLLNSISDISALSTLIKLTSVNLKSNYIPNTDEACMICFA